MNLHFVGGLACFPLSLRLHGHGFQVLELAATGGFAELVSSVLDTSIIQATYPVEPRLWVAQELCRAGELGDASLVHDEDLVEVDLRLFSNGKTTSGTPAHTMVWIL